MTEPTVLIERLTKTYTRALSRNRNVVALEDFSLEAGEGEIFGLLGPNGAGKSTLVKTLMGLVQPTAGSAFLFGVNIANPMAREKVGYLAEDVRYPPLVSASGYLRMCGRLSGVNGPLLSKRIDDLLSILDLERWGSTRLEKFSKGMLRRVGLAQALLNEPAILFLDEPSNGLDPIARKGLRMLLVKLREKGTTVFLNSHLLSEVELIADRVAILNKGKVVALGSVKDIIRPQGGFVVTVRQDSLPWTVLAHQENVRVVSKGDPVTIEVSSQKDLDALVGMLKSSGTSILSIVPNKPTLEESFVALIKNELTQ